MAAQALCCAELEQRVSKALCLGELQDELLVSRSLRPLDVRLLTHGLFLILGFLVQYPFLQTLERFFIYPEGFGVLR